MYIRRVFFAVVAATLLPTLAFAQSASFTPPAGAVTPGSTIKVTNNIGFVGVIEIKKEDGTVIETLGLAAGPGTMQPVTIPNDTSLIGTTITLEVSYPGTGQPGAVASYPVH